MICVFQKDEMWGAISKTNHGTLRYRDPVYLSIRELAMSYFHEYINDSGEKTLLSYSQPVDLTIFDDHNWMTRQEELWPIAIHLVKVEHFPLITKEQIASLRKADQIEIDIGKLPSGKASFLEREDLDRVGVSLDLMASARLEQIAPLFPIHDECGAGQHAAVQ